MPGVFDLPAQHDDLDAKLVVGLERVGQALRVLLRDEAKRFGLSPIQVQILVQLVHHAAGDRRVSGLAARFDVTKPTVSDAVKTLEAKGLVERRADPDDARAARLEPTARGREIAGRVERWAEPVRDALGALDADGKRSAFATVTALIAALQRSGAITVARMCRTCRYLEAREEAGASWFCVYLDAPLREDDLRIDCPEHRPVAEPG